MPRRPGPAALGAVVCLALLALVWIAAFHIGLFRHADQSIFVQFRDLHAHNRIRWLAGGFVALFNPNPYVYLVLVPLVVAMLRGRPRVVLAVAAIVLGANMATEVLKHLVAAPRPASLFARGVSPIPPVSWPSGHATAAMSLVLASVLAVPARLRPAVAALGAVLAVAVGYSSLTKGLHYPSDILGGFLVAAACTFATVAALMVAERLRPTQRPPSGHVSMRAALGAPGAVVAAALVLGAIVVLSRPDDVIAYARAHEAFMLGAAGIAALSLALSTVVVLSIRRGPATRDSGPAPTAAPRRRWRPG
jgi:membrane-associated phospholipid phosphatase